MVHIIDNLVLPKYMENINLSDLNNREKVMFTIFLNIVQNNGGYEFEITLDELSYILGQIKDLSFYHAIKDVCGKLREKKVFYDDKKNEHRIFDYVYFDEDNGIVRFRFNLEYENKLRSLGETIKNPKKEG